MTCAFMKYLHGTGDLDQVIGGVEYAPHTNPRWDPFSVVWNVSTLLSNASGDNMFTLQRFLARIRIGP
jgi:hypothetical protein